MVRTRFAPSPTGYLHVGGARTALFCWLYARRHGGRFILRVEDTDRERSSAESVQTIIDGLSWLGLAWDEGPVFQTERFDRYREVAQRLLEAGRAYRCYCSRERLEALREGQMARKEKPRYDGHCRVLRTPPPGVEPVIRFRNPDHGQVLVEDLVRGSIAFANEELDDLVIVRPDGTPTYNFTVVVDDADMEITHVIRGDDHVNNTPRQLNILEALGVAPPVYAHLPMILGADGQRLSKRHGAVSVTEYREQGYLADALLNHLARLGWSHGDQEIFARDDLVRLFDLAGVNRAAAAFNPEKLDWLNQHYMRSSPPAVLAAELGPRLRKLGIDPDSGPDLEALAEVQRERCKTLREMAEVSRCFFGEFDAYDAKAAAKHLTPETAPALEALRARLSGLADWSAPVLHAAVVETADALGLKLGKLAQPLRVAVSGSAASPSIEATLCLAGRPRTLARIDRALAHIGALG